MVIVSDPVACPTCAREEAVVRYGQNRCGTQRYRCRACRVTFTPEGKSRALSTEKAEQILQALDERISLRGAARLFKVGRATITTLVEKKLPIDSL